jgi:vitamin B12 transporter
VALFASGRFGLNEGLGALVLSFRNELSDGNTQPLVVSLGVEHDLLNKFRVKGNVSRNYRIPNLNDIYWREDGYAKGNPDLVAESGWSGDVGLSFKTDYQNFNLEVNSAFFASQTHDLIVWLPEDGGKWMPHNKRKGEVQGLEAGMDISTAFGDSEIHGKIFFTHTRSMLFSSDEYDGQEMVYIPRNQMSFSGGYARNSLYAALGGRYAGGRFYDFENTLDPYVLFDTSLGYIFALPAFSADLSFKINNVLDTNYQVVAWYAMPPRNYRITLSLTI